MIEYFTRSGVVSSEKIKVYITGHPGERETYIEQAHNILLNMYNCAVCIPQNGEINEDELAKLCPNIKLAVLVVSRKMLTENNSALDMEYRVLLEAGVSVLPIAFENGLDELFREKIGNIQYLNVASTDETARSFEEKAKDYLERIWGETEDFERYKEGFYLGCFISYRKKDRSVLLDFMKTVRSDTRCDVLSFWYDEMLTLGEHYDDEIERSIDDNQIFVLLVTPNLLEEDNYVWKYEYRYAKEAGKAIWPIMITPMSNEELSQLYYMYEDLPKIKTGSDILSAFAELGEMSNHDRSIATVRKLASVLHCRGMAYLNGVLTTIDAEKGVKYLERATNLGSIESYKRLFIIYFDGCFGISSDINRAIYWERELKNYLNARLDSCPMPGMLGEYFAATLQLAEIYKQFGDMNAAISEYMEMIKRAETIEPEERVPYAPILMAAYMSAALIFRVCGEENSADILLRKNDELNRLSNGGDTGENYKDRNWFVTTIQRMDAYFRDDISRTDEAYKTYMECLAWAEFEFDKDPTFEAHSDLASAYERLGDVFRVQADAGKSECLELSVKHYLLAYQYGMKARAEDNEYYVTINQANRARRVGEQYIKCGESYYAEAKTYLTKATNGFVVVCNTIGIRNAVNAMPFINNIYKYLYAICGILGDERNQKLAETGLANILSMLDDN